MTIYAARLTSFGLIFIRFRVARKGHRLLRMTIYAAFLTSFGLIFIRFRVAREGRGLLRMTTLTRLSSSVALRKGFSFVIVSVSK
jgi:hypothetical protein